MQFVSDDVTFIFDQLAAIFLLDMSSIKKFTQVGA